MRQFQLSIGDLFMFEVSDHSRNIEGFFGFFVPNPQGKKTSEKPTHAEILPCCDAGICFGLIAGSLLLI